MGLRIRLALAYAVLRGAVLVVFSLFLAFAPERAMPGASLEPARSLGLFFASRTLLLGAALIALALVKRWRVALPWVLCADAVLQAWDAGMSLAQGRFAVAVVPILIGVIDLLAGRALRSGPLPQDHGNGPAPRGLSTEQQK